ncbi:hypothetical protein IH981_01375 [Patescibacteria group bacterium]|nr:hypothetical protein [Patescibacteria group bacterium]
MLKRLPRFITTTLTFLFFYAPAVLAYDGEIEEQAEVVKTTLEDSIRSTSIKVVIIASVIVLGFVMLTILLKHYGEGFKKILFVGILIPTIITTLYMVGSTLFLNFTSSSGGPVHWHADLEIWDCGTKLDIIDPQGFSNKVGNTTFHEHNDGRMHVEGVVTKSEEASLGKFFGFIDGSLTSDEMRIPTNSGLIVRHDGDLCLDGNEGTLQVFVYQTKNNLFSQQKLTAPASYILSPESNVPPGDCIIIEFDQEKDKTDRLCNFYKLKIETGDLQPAAGALPESTNTKPDVDTEGATSSAQPDHEHEEGVAPHGH